MRGLILVALLVMVSGCHNYSTNVGDTLGCTLAGNGCISQGADGKDGAQGPAGQDGVNGRDGTNGLDGSDGSSISVVKLCPGETVYPSVFVEVALRIDGKLYAVYSLNGGFLVYLPPGRYTSNGVGSACNFTVTNTNQIVY